MYRNSTIQELSPVSKFEPMPTSPCELASPSPRQPATSQDPILGQPSRPHLGIVPPVTDHRESHPPSRHPKLSPVYSPVSPSSVYSPSPSAEVLEPLLQRTPQHYHRSQSFRDLDARINRHERSPWPGQGYVTAQNLENAPISSPKTSRERRI